ncbi:hypothetical protein AB1A65_12495 [Muricauda sp. ANG21]|uniref:hypothetical protein n=1 Tax=Allomuricauda sp. ANG21 TaxID=3042468 RepID=UPI003451F2A6
MRKYAFPKFAATLFFVLSLLFSCEKEEPLVLETNQDVNAKEGPYSLNSVDMEGIPKITDFLSSRAGKDIFKASANGKDDSATIAEEVIRVNDSLGQSNYSFHFTLPNSAENEFYNLVVGESVDGQPQEPVVFHYVCDPEYYEAFEESGFDPLAFVGTISMYPFDQLFGDGSLSKDICAEHDSNGDPIPCIRTNVTNGSSSSGAGGNRGGAPSSGGLPSPTTASYTISVTVYHVVPDGRTFTYGSGSKCEHPGECQIIYEVSTKADNKATDRGCTKCPGALGGVAANMASRTKLLVKSLTIEVGLTQSQQNVLNISKNRVFVEELSKYWRSSNKNERTKSFIKEFIELLKVPTSNSFDEEPVKNYVGVISDFVNLLDNSPRRVGKYKGKQAGDYLKSLGETEFNWKQMRPLPTQTGYFNNKKGRYIYTRKGGWIDMAHFMFYAGKAYKYKLDGKSNPIGEAVQDGYRQEASDRLVASHSAYSYEDLPSDKYGAVFAVEFFNESSNKTFSEQLKQFFTDELETTTPNLAPNYWKLPQADSKNKPSRTNETTTPVYISTNP